jgi:hypothetical protein
VNAVEIEQAISDLIGQAFHADEFPYLFLEAFGNKATTIKRLKESNHNKSDIASDTTKGVLHQNNIHIATCPQGHVNQMLDTLRTSPATKKYKVKFILATDGIDFIAEDMLTADIVACEYADFPNHFGFFLSLAGISTVKQIRDSSFDIKATSRLNRLYMELLKSNPDWGKAHRRDDMNHFMARLIFCFFAEDTDIFLGSKLFTATIEQMTAQDASNTHEVISEIFRAMNIKIDNRASSNLRNWADVFPYVNGGLFSGDIDVPKFPRISQSRSYLLEVGRLPWQKINPDIFGSMIQAVADDAERGALGMHYTSVPNILKVLNPLFLDDLNAELSDAGDNSRKLLNLRKRLSRIRIFDPACGSGNFLVIAYKELRKIEAEINSRRGETNKTTEIPITNFRGIEIRHFSAEIARLALIIAEYQCDVLYIGQKQALANFLPLDAQNWITCGNALRLDWLSICPPTATSVKIHSDDLFQTPLDQSEIDFENEGGETYICGNPPYLGSKWQNKDQKSDLINAWVKHPKLAKTTDLVTGWFARFLDYLDNVQNAVCAFVTTNSVCQGQQAIDIFPSIFNRMCEIRFAHTSFKWQNLASHNAGVTVVIIGLGKKSNLVKKLFYEDTVKECTSISPYLIPNSVSYVEKMNKPIGRQAKMLFGNMPRDGGHLFLNNDLVVKIISEDNKIKPFIKKFVGSSELIHGRQRYCLWIDDTHLEEAKKNEFIAKRLTLVASNRLESNAESTRSFAKQPHRFVQIAGTASNYSIVVPRVSSENRDFLPVDLLDSEYIIGDRNFVLYDAPLWNMALIASRLHWVWIGTVCVRMRTDFSYSNTLGWNTFPVPFLTEKNKQDLTESATMILLARESHFPATIADLYAPDKMPENLRHAHNRNDDILERIYIGRRFKNDTERLEKLFEMYTKMTSNPVKES